MNLMFPKPTKRIKPRKPIRRGKKRIAARSTFKAFGANCTKTYRRRFSDYEVRCQAEVCRQKRLAEATEAEMAFSAMLTRLGIDHEREKIILNGDRWVLIDVYVKSVKLAFELDGNFHADPGQKRYDHQRSMWLARQHSIKTVRFWNQHVMNGQAEQRVREMLGLLNL